MCFRTCFAPLKRRKALSNQIKTDGSWFMESNTFVGQQGYLQCPQVGGCVWIWVCGVFCGSSWKKELLVTLKVPRFFECFFVHKQEPRLKKHILGCLKFPDSKQKIGNWSIRVGRLAGFSLFSIRWNVRGMKLPKLQQQPSVGSTFRAQYDGDEPTISWTNKLLRWQHSASQFSLAMPSSWALVHSSQCLLRFWSTWTSMQMAQSTPQSSLTQQEEVYVPAWLHQWLSLNGHGPLPCYSLPMWLGSTVSPDPFGMPVVPPFKSFFFGILAIEVKRRARTAHTVCEMVLARWGKAAHLTFLFFAPAGQHHRNFYVASWWSCHGQCLNRCRYRPCVLLDPMGSDFVYCCRWLKSYIPSFLPPYCHHLHCAGGVCLHGVCQEFLLWPHLHRIANSPQATPRLSVRPSSAQEPALSSRLASMLAVLCQRKRKRLISHHVVRWWCQVWYHQHCG